MTLVALAGIREAAGQIQLVGEHLMNASGAELQSIGQTSVVYRPVHEDSPVLYFAPVFVFENASDGNLKVLRSSPTRPGDPWRVGLKLLVSPKWAVDSIATEVREWSQMQDNPDRKAKYKHVDSRFLIPTEFVYLSIRDARQGRPDFIPVVRTDIVPQEPVYLWAEFESDEAAQTFADTLSSRRTVVDFDVEFRLFARRTESEGGVKVEGVSLSETDGVQSLKGAGGAFTAQVEAADGVTIEPNILTRDQERSFRARIRNEMRADYVVETKEDLALLDAELDKWLASVFKAQSIALEEVGEAMKRLSDYGFAPADLSPDRIQKLVVEAKDFLSAKEKEGVSFSSSASASAFGFGGSASFSHTRDSLKKQMSDKGWTFGTDGETYLPKSLEVFVIDREELDKSFSIDIRITRKVRTPESFRRTVSTTHGLCIQGAEHDALAIARREHAARVAAFEHRLEQAKRSPLLGPPQTGMRANEEYTAETDGIVIAFNGSGPYSGDSPIILFNVNGARYGQFRGGNDHTITIPIRKGQKWKLETRWADLTPSEGRGTVVRFIPLAFQWQEE